MTDPATSSSVSIPADTIEVMGCSASNIDPSTGSCTAPVWVVQPTMLPPLGAGAGIAIAVAIGVCWTTAYVFRTLRQTGD